MQKVYGPPSSEHSHVVPSSLASNLKFATVLAVCGWFGPDRIVVTGGIVSGGCLTVQLALAGVGSTKPCVSTPRTENVCQPTASPVSWTGEVHVEYAALSSEHSWAMPVVLLKLMVAVVLKVSLAGAAVIVVSGGVTTVHCQTAGVGSKRPSLSSARTRSRCVPGPTGSSRTCVSGCWTGKTTGLHSSNRSPFSEHSYSCTVGSVESKRNVPPRLVVGLAGPETIVVFGSWFSIVNSHSSGVVSTMPFLTARTSKKCSPSGRPVYSLGELHVWKAPMSSAHWKVEFSRLDEKVNVT